MKKKIFTSIVILLFGNYGFAQKDTLSPQASIEFMKKLPFDSIYFLNKAVIGTCECLDSILINYKSREEVAKEISACIDKKVIGYQLAVKLDASLKGNSKSKTVSLGVDKNSAEYKRYYYNIEERLTDSCKTLRTLMSSNDKISEKSTSNDRLALKTYDEGVTLLKAEKHKEALVYFRKAVELDPEFAFAWDNVGICERKLDNYDAAIEAYNKSLAIDPKGKMPLQNLPYAYEFKKEYDNALKAIDNLLAAYPNDPEAFYSSGRIYIFFKKDYEKGLDKMCKAYNLYVEQKSPYRTDAQQNIQFLFSEMKKEGKEERFKEILKENKIKMN